MKVVVDTNVFIESISPKSRFHALFQALLTGKVQLYASNEMFLEYEEVVALKCKPETRLLFFSFLETSPYIHKITPKFRFNLISSDPDDNKFVDCAVAANVDYLVTADRDFKILKKIRFPEVKVISPEEFIKKYLS